jgi:hypothetical protein
VSWLLCDDANNLLAARPVQTRPRHVRQRQGRDCFFVPNPGVRQARDRGEAQARCSAAPDGDRVWSPLALTM